MRATHEEEKTRRGAAVVKQHLPSVSTGRPQLLRTNIRHAVAAYGLMVTVQSELRRSAVRNAARKTARVISAALCTPPNGLRPAPTLYTADSPSQPFRGMRAKCLRNAPRKNVPQSTLSGSPGIKTAGSRSFLPPSCPSRRRVIRLLN